MHGIAAGDRIAFQEVIKRLASAANLRRVVAPAKPRCSSWGSPGENVRSGHHAKLIGRSQIDKTAEVFQVILISTAGPWIVQVGIPLDCCRNLGQHLKFERREPALIVLMSIIQFLHILLTIGSIRISGGGFSHESNVRYSRCF
ncbi:hypothetical protein BV339_00324 [Pseudomonas syringae pv. actinidiae]|nr:hypothetical protein BV339_00324 [Pseudomonas syringae pv. actinidiae]